MVSAARFAHAAVVKYVTSHKKRIKQQRNGAEFADGTLLHHFLWLPFLLLLIRCAFFSNGDGGCRLLCLDGRWDRRGRQHAFFASLLLVWLLLLRWRCAGLFFLFGIAAAASQIRRRGASCYCCLFAATRGGRAGVAVSAIVVVVVAAPSLLLPRRGGDANSTHCHPRLAGSLLRLVLLLLPHNMLTLTAFVK